MKSNRKYCYVYKQYDCGNCRGTGADNNPDNHCYVCDGVGFSCEKERCYDLSKKGQIIDMSEEDV